MLNSQSVLRNDVTLYCLTFDVCFESSFVFFFIILAPGLNNLLNYSSTLRDRTKYVIKVSHAVKRAS